MRPGLFYHTAMILLAIALSLAPAKAAENWPQYRGTHGDGHSSAVGLSIQWSESENIRWKTAIHDKGWSSPVVWGDHIWLTTARPDGKALFALCIDRHTGKIVHDVKVFEVA